MTKPSLKRYLHCMKLFYSSPSIKSIKKTTALFLLLFMTKSAFSTSRDKLSPASKTKRGKDLIPQTCLNALSIKAKTETLKWTLRPGRGPQGKVRFIYQTVLLGKEETLLSLEKTQKALYLSLKNNDQIDFYLLTPSSPKECELKFLRTEKLKRKAIYHQKEQGKSNDRNFLNEDLNRLLKDSKEGIIYLWSPHMPYSVGSLYPLQKVAMKLKLPLTVLMDPFADEGETKKVIKRFNLPLKLTRKNKAERLLLQGATLHYPNYFFYREGKVSKVQLFGAKGEEALVNAIKNLASK